MAKLETITASELTNLVVHKTGRTRAEVKYVIDSIVEEVGECIAEGYNVSLFGLVKLSLKHSPAKPRRKGRNPRTGEEVMVKAKPESLKVRATVLKAVKDRLPSTRTGRSPFRRPFSSRIHKKASCITASSSMESGRERPASRDGCMGGDVRRELVNPRWDVVHDISGGVVLKVVVLGSKFGAVDIRFDNHIARELADRLIQVSETRAADTEETT